MSRMGVMGDVESRTAGGGGSSRSHLSWELIANGGRDSDDGKGWRFSARAEE